MTHVIASLPADAQRQYTDDLDRATHEDLTLAVFFQRLAFKDRNEIPAHPAPVYLRQAMALSDEPSLRAMLRRLMNDLDG